MTDTKELTPRENALKCFEVICNMSKIFPRPLKDDEMIEYRKNGYFGVRDLYKKPKKETK